MSRKKTPADAKKPRSLGARVNGLLPKQAKFVAEYLISGNATQAALAAGYSSKTAHVIGQENLKKPVIASLLAAKNTEIAARQDERLAAMELTKERVQREIARIAFFDPRKMFDKEGTPLPITELDDDTAACIVGLDVLEEWEGVGENRVLVGHVKKYKIANKNVALTRAKKIAARLRINATVLPSAENEGWLSLNTFLKSDFKKRTLKGAFEIPSIGAANN